MTDWEGSPTRVPQAAAATAWLSGFDTLFHRLMCECEHIYLNSNEHKRAHVVVETREARFVREVQQRYPLHDYRRLARIMHSLRAVKSSQY